MPLPVSSISVMCNEVSNFVRAGLNAASNNIAVTLGAPAEVADADDEHRVNLFFYRFEPSAFQAGVHPNDPWRVRMYCMITTFGIDEDSIGAGENELRMLGEIMRIFREQPISNPIDVGGETVRLQTVFSAATDEQINQVWSTQGDTAFRPSIIYEMALAPVMPSELRIEPPLVGSVGAQTRGFEQGRFAAFSGSHQTPGVPASFVDVANPMWVPVIAWVQENACQHTMALDVEDPSFASFVPQLWLAGDPAESINLVWQVWDSSGWTTVTTPVSATPYGTELTPDNIPAFVPATFPLELSLPISLAVDENAAQAMLYAERSVILSPGSDPVTLRSNPLLISLYRGTV